jgi:DNA polymerase-1
MVADHLLDEERLHGLKSLAKEILGVEETIKYEEAVRKGGEVFANYAMNDAIWTWQLCMWQQPRLKEQNLGQVFREIEMPFQHCIVEMETNGMLIDKEQMIKIRGMLKDAVDKFCIELHEEIGEPVNFQHRLTGEIDVVPSVNFDSTHVLTDILFNRLGLKSVKKTSKGKDSVGKELIEQYRRTVPFVDKLYKYKIASKLLNSYFAEDGQISIAICGDGRVRPSIRDTGTVTGRISITNPALQTLPKSKKDFPVPSRSVFTVEPSETLISVDFNSQELRVMAHLCQDENLCDLILKGGDQHLMNANLVFKLGIPKEKLFKGHPEFEEIKKKYGADRNKGKVFSFGLPYGMGEHKASRDFNVSLEEAKQMIENLFAGFPKLKSSIEATHREVDARGYVISETGRRRRFKKIKRFSKKYNKEFEMYDGSAYRESFNFKIQSTSADMMRLAFNNVFKTMKKHPEWNLKMLLTIHDEGLFSVRTDYLEEAIKQIKEDFESGMQLRIPIVAEVGTGKNYDDAK